MADLKQAYGSATSITITLNSLASSATAGRESTVVDNTTNLFDDVLVEVMTKVASGTIANDKCAYVYAYASLDGTNYSNGATGADAAFTPENPNVLRLLGVIPMPTQSKTYRSAPFSIAAAFGGVVPPKWGLWVRNYCGITLDSSGNAAQYRGVSYTVA